MGVWVRMVVGAGPDAQARGRPLDLAGVVVEGRGGGNWGLGSPFWGWALGLGGPVTSAPSWTGLQLIFAEHTLCGGPGRALSLPTTPSEGGAAIVAIFQMGKQARKS